MAAEQGPILYENNELLEDFVEASVDRLRAARAKYFQIYPQTGFRVPRLGVITANPGFDQGTGFYIKGLKNQSNQFSSYLELIEYHPESNLDQILAKIADGREDIYDGLILTLPLPPSLEQTKDELEQNRRRVIEEIPDILDVDAMKPGSPYVRPTPYAIEQIIYDIVGNKYQEHFSTGLRISVVGLGQVGLYLCDRLQKSELLEANNLELYPIPQDEIDEDKIKQSNVVVCTARGVGVIKPEHICEDNYVLLMNAGKKEVHPDARQRASIYVSDSQIGQLAIAKIYANTIQSHIQTRLAV